MGGRSGRRRRLGAALLVPEPVRTEVDALRRSVGDGSLGRVPAHLTLVPPVNVHERDLGAALSLLRDAAASCRPFTLAFGPPATFLPDNPVLYLSVSGDVAVLSGLRDAVFRPPLHRELAWPWVPHVTLCDEGDPDRVASAVGVLGDYRSSVTFDRVHVLTETDRVWVPFADAALGGRRVVGRGGVELEITESEQLDGDTRAWLDGQWALQNADIGGRWNQRSLTLVARRDGEVAGVATGWTNEGLGYLSELVVARTARGEGIGSRLLDAFEDAARRRGCTRLALQTDEANRAVGFYEARGWRLEATLTDWVDGRTTLQLRKDLGS